MADRRGSTSPDRAGVAQAMTKSVVSNVTNNGREIHV